MLSPHRLSRTAAARGCCEWCTDYGERSFMLPVLVNESWPIYVNKVRMMLRRHGMQQILSVTCGAERNRQMAYHVAWQRGCGALSCIRELTGSLLASCENSMPAYTSDTVVSV